ncbi:MAG TPA: hypothetical protein VGJ95_24015 [Pseudonocardiaceae bacterium]
MINGKRLSERSLTVVDATGYDVRAVIARARRHDLVDVLFSVVAQVTLTVLLVLFVTGNALYFGAGLLACTGLGTVCKAFEHFRFWRHHGRCSTCRERYEVQLGERLAAPCGSS